MTAPTVAAIDIGGTKIAVALLCGDAVLARAQAATPARTDGRTVVAQAASMLSVLAADLGRRPVSYGAGVAGVVDAAGRVRSATDSIDGWDGTDVAGILTASTGLPGRVVNDVHALAVGEAAYGAGTGCTDVVAVAVGTGIGGGVISGGRLLTGASGAAGHLGHLPVAQADGLACPCGASGHVEAVASGPAITADYAAVTRRRVHGLEQVAAAAAAGDRHAQAALHHAGTALGTVLGGLINTFDPQVVIVGGGAAVPALLRAAVLAARVAAMPIRAQVPVVPAMLGADAALYGAAVLASQEIA